MQVTCPNCRARYAVDPLAIGPSGRTVQCARCSERWYQMVTVEPPPPAPPSPPAESSAAETREPAVPKASAKLRLPPWLSLKPGSRKPVEAKAKAEPRAEVPAGGPPADAAAPAEPAARVHDTAPVPDFVIRPPTRGAMLPALIEPKASRRISYLLVGALAVIILLIVGVLAFHNVIADQLPIEWRSILHFDA